MIRLRTVRRTAVSVLLAGLLVVAAATVLTKVALAIFFTPSSIDTTGLVSPAFGPAVAVITTEYDAFGVHFSDAGVDTGIFDDGVLAWSGINASGDVDLIAPVQGKIVVPGTGGVQGQTSSLSVEGGFAGLGNLLLEVFDCDGNLIGSTINDDGTGPNGRRLMTLAIPGIASFRVSTPAPGGLENTFGVDSIDMEEPVPCVPTPTISLDPPTATNTVGDDHTVTATVTFDGVPSDDVPVLILVFDGPNAGELNIGLTDGAGPGQVSHTYTGDGEPGTDGIVAVACNSSLADCTAFFEEFVIPFCPAEPAICISELEFICPPGESFCAVDDATKEWVPPTPTPTPTPTVLPAVQTPTATPTPTPTVLAAAALPATGGEPSDGGTGALGWLAAIAGAVAVMSAGGVWLAYGRRRVR